MSVLAPLSDITNFRRSQSNVMVGGCQALSPLMSVRSSSSMESTMLSPEAMSPLAGSVRSIVADSPFTASTTYHVSWTRHEPYNWKCIPESEAQIQVILAQRAESHARRLNLRRLSSPVHVPAQVQIHIPTFPTIRQQTPVPEPESPVVATPTQASNMSKENSFAMASQQIQIPSAAANALGIRCLVQFKCHHAEYSSNIMVEKGQYVYVQGDRGMDIGVVIRVNTNEQKTFIERTGPCGSIVRHATQREVDYWAVELKQDEQTALDFCRRRCIANDLLMEVKFAEFQFDKKKLTFYYDAKNRVDFVNLLKELYREFGCRIWMEKVRSANE